MEEESVKETPSVKIVVKSAPVQTEGRSIKFLKKVTDNAMLIVLIAYMLWPIYAIIFSQITGYIMWSIMRTKIFAGLFLVVLFCEWLKNGFKIKFCSIKDIFKKHSVELCFVLFLIWGFIATMFSCDRGHSFWGTSSVQGYTSYLIYFLFFFVVLGFIDKKYTKLFVYLFNIVISVVAIIDLIDKNNEFIIYFDKNTTTLNAGVFVNSNHFAYLLCMAIMATFSLAVFEKNWALKIFNLSAFAYLSYFLNVNNTLGSFIASLFALVVALIIILIKKGLWYNKILAIAGVCAFVLISSLIKEGMMGQLLRFGDDIGQVLDKPLDDASKSAGTYRWGLWLVAFGNIKHSPLFGTGIGFFKRFDDSATSTLPHNEYLNFASEMGIPCLVFYVFALIIMLVMFFKNFKKHNNVTLVTAFMILAYLVSAFFGNVMPHTYPYFMIFLAFFLKRMQKE